MKYSKDHMLMLVFIYYFKNLLSFSDIEELFRPITSKHFSGQTSQLSLEDIYNEVFTLEKGDVYKRQLRQYSVAKSFSSSMELYSDNQSHSAGTLHWMANCLHSVSYTHLDVYKRQAVRLSTFFTVHDVG